MFLSNCGLLKFRQICAATFFLGWVSLAFPETAAKAPLAAGQHELTLTTGGRTRSCIVFVPKSYDAARPTPLVLVFHGGGGNAESMVAFTGLNAKAEESGFVVVYPNGTGFFSKMLTWNGGNCCGYAQRNNIDDVAFVRALLDDLATVLSIDPRRVFATGMSNGAIMSYLLASKLSDRIAAIAPVGGPMGTETCSPKRPVSVIHFHGTEDQFAAYEGGPGKKSLTQTDFLSVEHSIRAWVKANGCPETPVEAKLPDKAADGMAVTMLTYGPGKEDSEVVLVCIEKGGHTWPGGPSRLKFLGPSTKDISANDMMWEFFQKHPMKPHP